jgi:hypothetical protein
MPTLNEMAPRLQQALLFDWDAPELRGPLFLRPDGVVRKKLADLASPRSDNAVTWSVFRTLQRLPSAGWLPHLLDTPGDSAASEPVTFDWWPSTAPAPARLLWLLDHTDGLSPADPTQQQAATARLTKVAQQADRWRQQIAAGADRGDGVLEPAFETDLAISTPTALVLVIGLYRRDIERRTYWDPQRDTLARGLDAALRLAGTARAPWLLLLTDDYRHEGPDVRAMAYESLALRYRDPAFLAARLPHLTGAEHQRLTDHLRWLSWADLLDVVLDHAAGIAPEGRLALRRLVDYLKDKRLLFKGG